MLAKSWSDRKNSYEFVIVGSGYGGAITAARLALSGQVDASSVCLLERGREWPVGQFPDEVTEVLRAARNDLNPGGLYEFLTYRDISIIKGSGLGGTSLINANVAIVPDAGVFERGGWPAGIRMDEMLPYYDRAFEMLAAVPHPRGGKNPQNGPQLTKVQALQRRATELGLEAQPLRLAVNFDIDGPNPHGVEQKPCIDCGDCVTGCNVGAKNTLYMNYLPAAARAGVQMFTESEVAWIEKLPGGGWRVHGTHYEGAKREAFTIDAKNVFLCAGSLNSTEILLRSEQKGLKVSPALGTRFSGNGDFFGLAYNGDFPTDVLGYGTKRTPKPGRALPPGPSIVGVVRYNGGAPLEQRITVEDFSFPSAYVKAAQLLFKNIPGEDTYAGNEFAEFRRRLRDLWTLELYERDGALNHTMLYLVMGLDDARGLIALETGPFHAGGRLNIVWHGVGQQQVFTRMNAELRRHARALHADYISNPTWSVFNIGHLITAHPLGGCPMGEDYMDGAVDEFGRVFAADGSVHEGLFVSDGAVVRSALGVNPFMTISALAERTVARKIEEMRGQAYPTPPVMVGIRRQDATDYIEASESELEMVFRRSPTLPIEKLVNADGAPQIDLAARRIRNDRYWKGFFPKGHILNTLSAAIFTGFKKEFRKEGSEFLGITSDTDGRIRARNRLTPLKLARAEGTLEAGEYIKLEYLDLPWTGYYDILKIINENLIVGRVYFGPYPNGIRMFTFAMTREYTFAQMTVDDHQMLWDQAAVPSKEEMSGVWEMSLISNNNHLGAAAYLAFDNKPDGRLEARYQLMGLMEGLVMPAELAEHFQLTDFTPFRDEIRKLEDNLMIGKYVVELPGGAVSIPGGNSLGVLHAEPETGKFGFYYVLNRTDKRAFPTNTLLRGILDRRLPDGLGMTFDEEMVGWYWPGVFTGQPGRAGDLTIEERIPKEGDPPGAVACKFQVRMTVRDLNEFIEGYAHEATMRGTIQFGKFAGQNEPTYIVEESRSRFNYLRVNPGTGEAEMNYHIEFRAAGGKNYIFEGRKYMQKDDDRPFRAPQEILHDYTTLYAHVYESADDGRKEIGTAYLKFRTFQDLAAVGNLAGFLGSFRVTGTDDPFQRAQGQLRFLAFTAQFVMQEYDPLAPPLRVRAAGGGGSDA